jgi:2-octaprenylphenol hydroxylase
MRNYDLTIVGASMIGASLALAIAKTDAGKKLKIALVDAQTEYLNYQQENFDPRVVALSQASQNFLEKVDVWDAIKSQRVCAYTNMKVWDGEGTASIHFDARDIHAPHLGHIVENSVIVNALHEKIKAFSNIEFICATKVLDVQRTELLNLVPNRGEPFTTSLLIAADGAESHLRELLQFPMREWDYGHQAIVATVEIELPHQQTAWQRFMHTGPLAFLPLPTVNNKNFCSIVWSAENNLAEKLMQLSDNEFCGELAKAFEYQLGEIKFVSKRFSYPLKQRHAKGYIQSGAALVGDAAHTIHPLAGQGANLGFMDAQILASEITRALDRNMPVNDFSILRRYQRQRLGHNLTMMTAMEAFKQLFSQRSPGWNGLRNFGMRKLDSQPVLKNFIIKQAMGL